MIHHCTLTVNKLAKKHLASLLLSRFEAPLSYRVWRQLWTMMMSVCLSVASTPSATCLTACC